MALLLRRLKAGVWHRGENLPWLSTGQAPLDALTDLQPRGCCTLSFWEIDNATLDRAIAALAVQPGKIPDHFEFVLIDGAKVKALEIAIQPTKGETADSEVNGLHRDLVQLSAGKVAELADLIAREGSFDIRLEKEICTLADNGLKAGHIKESLLASSVRKTIDQVLGR